MGIGKLILKEMEGVVVWGMCVSGFCCVFCLVDWFL